MAAHFALLRLRKPEGTPERSPKLAGVPLWASLHGEGYRK